MGKNRRAPRATGFPRRRGSGCRLTGHGQRGSKEGKAVKGWAGTVALVTCLAVLEPVISEETGPDPERVVGPFVCAECHKTTAAKWETSRHATASCEATALANLQL